MRKFLLPRDPSFGASKGETIDAVDLSATLPPGSRLPVLFTPYFTDREAVIASITGAMGALDQAAPAPIIISGNAGSGRTQVAGAVIGHQVSHFEAVHWIEASQPGDIPLQIAACGEPAALASKNHAWPERIPDQVEVTLNAWRAAPNRLVIFNHMADPDVFTKWNRELGPVTLLVTTANPDWPAGDNLFRLDGFDPSNEAIALLHLIAPRLVRSAPDELEKIGVVLAGSPFGLSLAGCYLRERARLSPKDCLAEIEKKSAALDTAAAQWVASDPTSRTPALAALLLLLLKLLEGRSDKERTAWRILHTASMFSPHLPVPLQYLSQLVVTNPNQMAQFDQSLAWLYSLGLMTPSPLGPVLHSLVAELAPAASPQAAGLLPSMSENFLGLVSSAQMEKVPNWLVIPHMRAIAERSEQAGLKPAGAMWNRLGALLYMIGESSEARALLERSLAFNARNVGGDRLETAAASAALGRALSDLGDLPGAQNAYEKALAIYEKVFGPVYPEVANVASLLGQVMYEIGDYPAAKTYFDRALSIHENAFGYGPNHPAVITDVDFLGRTLRELNNLPAALKYFERALTVEEVLNGPNHPNIATRANNLGRIQYKLGQLDSARTNFERALTVLQTTQGPENASLATALNNLGLVLQDLSSLEKARECFEKALHIDEKLFGSEHPNVARDANNLGSVYSSLGKLSIARDCFIRALEIDRAVFGESHPNNAINANNLGRVLYNLGDLEGAQIAFDKALEVDTKLHGKDHPRIGTDLNNLGTVLFEKGQLENSRLHFERALVIFSKHLEPDHPKIAYARKFLNRITTRTQE